MEEETSVIRILVASYCDGPSHSKHGRVNFSALDNCFRTLDAAIAKDLESKGYTAHYDAKAKFFVIRKADAPPPEIAGSWIARLWDSISTGSRGIAQEREQRVVRCFKCGDALIRGRTARLVWKEGGKSGLEYVCDACYRRVSYWDTKP
jgi:hypothetical protein